MQIEKGYLLSTLEGENKKPRGGPRMRGCGTLAGRCGELCFKVTKEDDEENEEQTLGVRKRR